MLPKTERLTKEDFMGVRPKIFFRGTFFDISFIPQEKSKYSCIISKKKISKATERNAVKRKLFAVLENEKGIQSGHYFFYIKKEANQTTFSLLEEEIKKAFATLN